MTILPHRYCFCAVLADIGDCLSQNFTYGNPVTKEFFSPGFPGNYPAGIKCFRTITADYGYFVRVDFRDFFHIEPPSNEGNCDYDYLEVSSATLHLSASNE